MGVSTLGDGTGIGGTGSGAMGVSTLGDGTGIGGAGFGENEGEKRVGVCDGLFWLRMDRRRARAVGGGVGGDGSLGALVGGHGRRRSVRDVGSRGGKAGVVTTPKMAARSLIAAICSVPREGNGEAGAGLLRAAMSSCAAAVAASADEVAGILAAWGKNSTEREMRLAFVLGM